MIIAVISVILSGIILWFNPDGDDGNVCWRNNRKEISDKDYCYQYGDRNEDGSVRMEDMSEKFNTMFMGVIYADAAVIFIRLLAMFPLARDAWVPWLLYWIKDNALEAFSIVKMIWTARFILLSAGRFVS